MSTSIRTPAPAGATVPAAPAGPLGRIIATSIATGAIAAAVLTFVVLPDASEAASSAPPWSRSRPGGPCSPGSPPA